MIREPMVLGHEVVGTVAAVGRDVHGIAVGDPVAVHPATPCGQCEECLAGRRNICGRTRYLGSAAMLPHVQGGFAQEIVVPAAQIRVLPADLSLDRAVLAEPLSVALHAVRRAGDVSRRSVLVTGAGPIGALVVAALKHAGAAEITVSDLLDEPLVVATSVGATTTVHADNPDDPNWPQTVDIAIEASGSPAGLASCVQRVRRGGTVVLLGLLPPGQVPFFGNVVVTRELELKGAFRFDTEFDTAIELLTGGLPVGRIVSHTFPLFRAHEAFDLAGNRAIASKVLLDFRSP